HEEVTTYAGLLTSPDVAKMVAIGVCYSGPLAEGERLIAPVRQFGPPLADQIRLMAYTEIQSLFDAAYPPDISTIRKTTFCGRSAMILSTFWSTTLRTCALPYLCHYS